MRRTPVAWSAVVALAVTTLAACSDSTAIVEPTPTPSADIAGNPIVTGQLFGPTTVTLANAAATPGHITICKAGVSGTFTIQIFAHVYQTDQFGAIIFNNLGFPIPLNNPDGSPMLNPTPVYTNVAVTINAGECVQFHASTPFEFTVVATENASATTVLQSITAFTINAALTSAQPCGTGTLEFCQINLAGRTVTLGELNQYHGGIATFTNAVLPPPPPLGCTLTQGYWKNHPDAWPVSSLTLGTVGYSKTQLLAIMNTPVKGNGLIALAYQLIAAKLNVASGASSTTISAAITSADGMIGGLVIPPVGSGYLSTSATSSLTAQLDTYNNGLTQGGPPHCGN